LNNRLYLTMIILFLFFSVFTAAKQTSELLLELKSLQKQVEFSNELNDESLLEDSIDSINKLILNNPGNMDFEAKAYVVLGDAYFYRGNFLSAQQNYQKAIDLLPETGAEYPYCLYSMIYSYYYLLNTTTDTYRQNYINNATILLDKLYSYEEYRQDSLLLRGMILKENKDYSGAVGAFEQINSAELTGLASYYKGLILYQQGNYPSAILAFQKASDNGEDKDLIAASIYQVINAMINLKNYQDAIVYSEKLIRDFGSSRYKNEIFKQHVEILYRTGDYQNAKKYIENILLNASDNQSKMEAYNVIGWLAYETNNLNEAVQNWKNAINAGFSQYPSQAFEIAKTCIEALSETGDYTRTLSFLNEIKAQFPNKKTEIDLETAKVYMNTNRYAQAEQLLNSVLSTGLYYNEVNYLTALLNREMNNSRVALDYIRRVINSGNASYVYKGYLFEGDLYFQLSDYSNAKISYENAMKIADDFGRLQCLLNLGIVEMELKNYNQAKDYFNELKSKNLTDLDASLTGALYLAEVYYKMGDNNNAVKEYDWIIENDKTGKYISNSMMKKYDILLSATSANYDSIITELDKQINSTSDLVLKDELKFLKAEAYMKKGDLLTAFNFCRDVNFDRLSASSKAAVLYIRGKYFISQNNETELQLNFDNLIENYPNSPKTPWAMQDYALYYYNNQNYNQSKNLFFNLLTKYPEFQKVDVAYFYIGLCYEKMGESDQARQIFSTFLEKFPESARTDEVKQHLSWLE